MNKLVIIETTKYLKPDKNIIQKRGIYMLFFKPKPKEILPPPPPYSTSQQPDTEEEFEKKHKFFDKVLKPGELKTESFPEEEEFKGLVEELEEPKQKKTIKKVKISPKRAIVKKAEKITKIKPKPVKKIPAKQQIKIKKPQFKKIKEKKPKSKALKGSTPKIKAGLGEFEVPEFKLPKELEPSEKELEMPENLDEFGMDFGREFGQETKPKEVMEAQEEIKSAIENIKKQEKPSFFKKLFSRSEKTEKPAEKVAEEYPMPELEETDAISKIQNNISKARQALMKFDLEAAKKNYIEAMALYNSLNPEEQSKVYHDIRELYFERKSAEELKV